MEGKKLYDVRFKDLTVRKSIWRILIKHFFQQYFDNQDRVLDIGCGYGEFINTINCKSKIALDTTGEYKQYLSKDVRFLHASSTKIPLKDNSVDKIFISNVFEHLTRNDIKLTIKECRRVLRCGGNAIILQPNSRYCYKDYWMFFDHITPIDDRALEEIFSFFDFTLYLRINKFLPYTTKSILPKADIFITLYLFVPILWKIFGKQSFLIFKNEKDNNH